MHDHSDGQKNGYRGSIGRDHAGLTPRMRGRKDRGRSVGSRVRVGAPSGLSRNGRGATPAGSEARRTLEGPVRRTCRTPSAGFRRARGDEARRISRELIDGVSSTSQPRAHRADGNTQATRDVRVAHPFSKPQPDDLPLSRRKRLDVGLHHRPLVAQPPRLRRAADGESVRGALAAFVDMPLDDQTRDGAQPGGRPGRVPLFHYGFHTMSRRFRFPGAYDGPSTNRKALGF